MKVCMLPPVGADAAPDLEVGVTIAVGGVVVVPTRIELDGGVGAEAAKGGDVDVGGARAQHENIDQLFAHPGFYVDAVEVASGQIFRDAGGEQ